MWLDSDTELKLGLSRMTVLFAGPVPAPDSVQATALRPVDRTVVRTARPPAPRPAVRVRVPPAAPAGAGGFEVGSGGLGVRARGGSRHWWTLAAAALGLGMNVLDGTVVNVALPSIQRDLHSSFSTVQWVVNAYLLSFAILLATGDGWATSSGAGAYF